MLVVLGLGGFAAWKLVGPGAGDSAAAAADGLIYVGTTAAGADADAGCALAVQLVEKVR